MNRAENGTFIISLDFELHWGVRDKRSVESYRDSLLGVRRAIPLILNLFKEYNIHATWATVGLLMFSTKEELLKSIPNEKPSYTNINLSPYPDINNYIGINESNDQFHFGYSLVKQILTVPNQEIASHTFCHYYCLEEGQSVHEFEKDVIAFKNIARKNKINVKTIIFPRNQINNNYKEMLLKNNLLTYRGNPKHWLYTPKNERKTTKLIRTARVIDSYINLFGHNCYSMNDSNNSNLVNVAASRFLRPYSQRLKFLERLKIRRIKKDLKYAAKNNLIYHLWWHPHNFGNNVNENIKLLKEILEYYKTIKGKYGIRSENMGGLTSKLKKGGDYGTK